MAELTPLPSEYTRSIAQNQDDFLKVIADQIAGRLHDLPENDAIYVLGMARGIIEQINRDRNP